MNELFNLYVKCMNCTETACPGVWKDISEGIPPRAFNDKNNVDILVVGKNPGHPLNGERDLLKGASGEELVSKFAQFCKDLNSSSLATPPTIFHRNLLRYLSYFLCDSEEPISAFQKFDYGAHLGVLDRVAMTNLVKCSTIGETDRLNTTTIQKCFMNYLEPEIKIMRPKVILALGSEVALSLNRLARNILTPVVQIKHPSYFYKRDNEAEILSQLKKVVRTLL